MVSGDVKRKLKHLNLGRQAHDVLSQQRRTLDVECLCMLGFRNNNDMRGFLAGEEGGNCESESEEGDLIQEISCRHILHWNYRGLTSLPKQLLGRNY